MRENIYTIKKIDWRHNNTQHAGWPTAAITVTNENGDERQFYLMPFRHYRFQVCKTETGEMDCGASEVIQYREVFKGMPYFVTSGILTDAAKAALFNFIKPHGWGTVEGQVDLSVRETQKFNKYIDECHRLIFGTPSNYIVD